MLVSIWIHLPVSGKLSNLIYLILMKMENALLYDFKKKKKGKYTSYYCLIYVPHPFIESIRESHVETV